MTYAQVIRRLHAASIPVRELEGRGVVAVATAAGRVVAMSFSKDGPNLFWSNPQLTDTALVKATPEKLAGGFGGDRLWFSPELRYHWIGKPDWRGLGNYEVPKDTDPGRYIFVDKGPGIVALSATGRLPFKNSDGHLAFSVEREIRMTNPPLPLDHPLLRHVDYVGIETTHTLKITDETRTGEIDLWHLLQMPAGSILIVPLRHGHRTEPLSYGMPGSWHTTPNSLIWRFTGTANAKIGLAAEALTGRSAVLRNLGDKRWCLIVRQFPFDTAARYGDHPEGIPREDQAFQAWDGVGFGEMEYHSPVLDAARGPRTLDDTDQLWAFGGSARAIVTLAYKLLGVDISALFPDAIK